ncbi:MAG: hypothetical protein LAT81_12835 [Oceanicaulis sp.]|nr:hypothetical protein [Oceanicaulis sp.]
MAGNKKTAGCHRRLPENDQLAGQIRENVTPELQTRQSNFVARRFGIAPHVAIAIAALAFERRAAR